jgi:hypothetical protein
VKGVALRIYAAVRMQPESALPATKPPSSGWGATISYRGKLFPGRVLVCQEPIEPGKTGEATIGVIANSRNDIEMQVGSVFELKNGFATTIATATVLTVAYDS